MQIAFYAPMKPPTHPTPSGDRRMANLLMAALRETGHEVYVASRLRSYNRDGDRERQAYRRRVAARIAKSFIDRPPPPGPDLWFTYHLYHKAPDWLGPRISEALGIPYVVAEASSAPKQADGLWAEGYRDANAAIAQADRLIVFDPLDIECLVPLRKDPADIVQMTPFCEPAPAAAEGRATLRERLARAWRVDPDVPWMAAVAMMRHDAKLDSYRVLAEALTQLPDLPWTLLVAGDGPASPAVETLLDGLGTVRFLGRLYRAELDALYQAADFAVWPAINESYGMALVEAQMAGLPVVAGARPGVAAIVAQGESGLLTPVGDAAAFAEAIARLLDDPAERSRLADGARRLAAGPLSFGRAVATLDSVLDGIKAREMA